VEKKEERDGDGEEGNVTTAFGGCSRLPPPQHTDWANTDWARRQRP
jgi:hypothetical protein